jgi:hypothetical protein
MTATANDAARYPASRPCLVKPAQEYIQGQTPCYPNIKHFSTVGDGCSPNPNNEILQLSMLISELQGPNLSADSQVTKFFLKQHQVTSYCQ